MYNFTSILPELALAAGALALLLLGIVPGGRRSRAAEVLALAALVVALALLPAAARAGQGPVLGGMVVLDGFGTFFRAVLIGAALVVVLTGARYVAARGLAAAEFYALLLMAVAGADFMAVAGDIISFYVGLETLSLASYGLAGFLVGERFSMEAALKYFLNGATASALLLFGLSLVFGLTGTTSLAGIASALAAGPWSGAAGVVPAVALLFVLAGLAFKVAAVPFHLWAPDVYEGAPTPVSAFLSLVSKGGALAAIVRVVAVGLAPLHADWQLALAVLSALTMTVGNVSAIWQKNVKRLLAYSSVAHAGYVLAGIAVGTAFGLQAVLFYILAYLFMNLGGFGVVMALSSQGEGETLDDLTGLARRSPWLAALLTLFALSLLGLPWTAGFMGKLLLFQATISSHMTWLALFIAINTGISAYYYFLLIRQMYLRGEDRQERVRPDALLVAGLAVAAAGVLVLGIFPQSVLEWSQLAAFMPLP
ncbi:MAG: NADH-quinone oxidoreductase subunit N [Clostridia bacterium]|nr:NADH-quinone oxidoreductase subunit N [Clostridia bacterium]